MKLRPPSYLVLGMLRLGVRSGYAIKQAADRSTQNFWPTSLAQVYPELAALEGAGLVSRSDDARGRRRRSAYALTDDGERALTSWLESERLAPAQLRDEGLLRLFFADALAPAEQLALVRRLRAADAAAAEWVRREAAPAADRAREAGLRYPATVARLSADLFAFSSEWLARLERELEEDSKDGSVP